MTVNVVFAGTQFYNKVGEDIWYNIFTWRPETIPFLKSCATLTDSLAWCNKWYEESNILANKGSIAFIQPDIAEERNHATTSATLICRAYFGTGKGFVDLFALYEQI
jgi:hypothetical protein